MSEDHDPLAETRQFQPIDPYNIGPDTAGAPLPDPEDGGAAGYGTEPGAPGRGGLRRLRGLGAPRLVALGTAAVLVVGGVAWGATALASSKSSSSQPRVQDQLPEDAGASPAGGGKRAKAGTKTGAKAARVTIAKLGTGSFTGTDAKGRPVTVVYGDDIRFGTKARPLSVDQLQAGMVVTVAGTRSGETITAVLVAVPGKKAEATATPTG